MAHRSLAWLAWLVTLASLGGGCGAHAPRAASQPVQVQLLAFNDFHGQLGAGKTWQGRPVGSAPVLAAYLRAQQRSFAGDTLIIHAGDHVGASPPASALLQDEPSISFLNLLANEHCTGPLPNDPRCNLVGTPGNHELDEGAAELLRLIRGGDHTRGPFLGESWRGARFPYVSASIVDDGGATLLPPYALVEAGGVRIGVIGAQLQDTPNVVAPSGVVGLHFLPEAQAINAQVAALRAQGVEAIVVTMHQGGEQPPYEGPTDTTVPGPGGAIAQIVAQLDDAVDVVISGHAHDFSNAFLRTRTGHRVLVTQAFSAGRAFAAIRLTLHRKSGDVMESSARVITTFADVAPGDVPAADVAALVARAEQATAPLMGQRVGEARERLCRDVNEAGESPLGDLIADAQREATGAEVALMNEGGIRADLEAGPITRGALFTIQPFGNTLVSMDLTGAQLRALFEQQLAGATGHLQVSGLRYTYSASAPANQRVREVWVGAEPLDVARVYRVVTNNFLASGGDGYTVFREGHARTVAGVDLDALIAHVERQRGAVGAPPAGRITRLP